MATNSKYVTDEDIQEARNNLVALDEELAELVLSERAGNDVTELRKQINDTKAKLSLFIATYDATPTKAKTSRSK